VDPRALVQERSHVASAVEAPLDRSRASGAAPEPPQSHDAGLSDLETDARLLAEYGDSPRHWLVSPLYALRVFKRQRVLTAALVGRRSEAATAQDELDTAIAAFASRVRATAETTATYVLAIEELQRAEEVLRAREGLLAEERDAHEARLSLVDERLTNLEAELAQAAAERPADAKQHDSEAQKRLASARSERASLEHWLKRQGEARKAAAQEARERVRGQMVALGRRAMSDRGTFGAEFDPSRDEIARLQAAQQSAARDVMVHEAALGSHDSRSFRRGLLVAVVLVLVLVVAPIVWRATRVVEPPTTHVVTGP
jgi:hypothetical protein